MSASSIAFIINRHAGNGSNHDWLEANRERIDAIANGGPVAWVENGDEIRAAVERALAQGCGAVVAGGGDGTLNAVASRLVDSPVAFGVLALGTLNHFAHDAGIPLDLSEALDAIAAGRTRQLDIGQVNERHFLNNASIGLYVDLVRDREKQQTRLGRGKWPAFVFALIGAFRRYPFLTVSLSVDGRHMVQRTAFVFIGNNAYQTEGLQIGQREALDAGQLSVYVAHRAGRWRLIALGLRALVGKLRQARDFKQLLASEIRVETGHRQLRVATDGEVCRLDAPLQFRIRPGALRVIVAEEGAASPDKH
ncbi:MAG: diacylglycerol kinase family protein [Ideonella sp.]